MKVILSALLASAVVLAPAVALAEAKPLPFEIVEGMPCVNLGFYNVPSRLSTDLYSVRLEVGEVLTLRDMSKESPNTTLAVRDSSGVEVYRASQQISNILQAGKSDVYTLAFTNPDVKFRRFTPPLIACIGKGVSLPHVRPSDPMSVLNAPVDNYRPEDCHL